jgi:hypothetical protein
LSISRAPIFCSHSIGILAAMARAIALIASDPKPHNQHTTGGEIERQAEGAGQLAPAEDGRDLGMRAGSAGAAEWLDPR